MCERSGLLGEGGRGIALLYRGSYRSAGRALLTRSLRLSPLPSPIQAHFLRTFRPTSCMIGLALKAVMVYSMRLAIGGPFRAAFSNDL